MSSIDVLARFVANAYGVRLIICLLLVSTNWSCGYYLCVKTGIVAYIGISGLTILLKVVSSGW